jgi:hypothetical protein
MAGQSGAEGFKNLEKGIFLEKKLFFASQPLEIPQNRQRNIWKNLTNTRQKQAFSCQKPWKNLPGKLAGPAFHVKQSVNAERRRELRRFRSGPVRSREGGAAPEP